MKVPFFDARRQIEGIRKEVLEATERVLFSGSYVLGKEGESFEKSFSEWLGIPFGISVNSCTDALKIALKALDLKPGDEIITSANTAIPTVSAIREVGAVPVLVDIKDNFLIDENRIEPAITHRTKAIIPVHLYGQSCDMDSILKIANKHQLFVVEDCAQAAGTLWNTKKVGTLGNAGCFSFYPTKNLGGCGDGGMIVTANKQYADRCRQLRMYGIQKNYHAEIEGYNSRMDEVQSAILNVKLGYLKNWNNRRKNIAKRYITEIKNSKLILPQIDTDHIFHLFVIRTKDRDTLAKHLQSKEIGYGIHYPFPIHKQKAYQNESECRKGGFLGNSEAFSREIISIPIFPELSDEEISYIIESLNRY